MTPRDSTSGDLHRPWRGRDPLVLVSLGSTYQRQEQPFARAVAALGTLPVRGLATYGAIDPPAGPAPNNVAVIRSAPHAAALPLASVVVCHGGHGTVMKALAHGLPIVVMPRDAIKGTMRQGSRCMGRREDFRQCQRDADRDAVRRTYSSRDFANTRSGWPPSSREISRNFELPLNWRRLQQGKGRRPPTRCRKIA